MTRPSGRGGRRPAASRASHARSVASKTAPSRFDAVSSGPNIRKFVAALRRDDVAQPARRARGSPRSWSRPARGRRRRSRGSRAGRRSRSSTPPLACGFAPMRRSPVGRERLRARAAGRPSLVEQLLGPVAAHPRLELPQVLGVVAQRPAAAPGARATCPRPAGRRPPSARSSPSACAARSSASAAARRLAVARRRAGSRAISSSDVVERRGHALVHRRGVVAARRSSGS